MFNENIISNFLGIRNVSVDKIREKINLLKFIRPPRNPFKFAIVAKVTFTVFATTANKRLNILLIAKNKYWWSRIKGDIFV